MKKIFSNLMHKVRRASSSSGNKRQTENPDVFDKATGTSHFEAHGDRWRALPDSRTSAAKVAAAFTESETTRFIKLNEKYALAFEPTRDASNAYIVSALEGHVLIESFFPLLKGLSNKVSIEAVHRWKVIEGVEADIFFMPGCGARMSCFCPTFALDSAAFIPDAEVMLNIAAWAYSARKAENKPIPLNPKSQAYSYLKEKHPDREPVVYLEGSRICMPADYASEYNYHVPIEAAEHVDFCGFPMWKITTSFVGETQEDSLHGYLYVSEHILAGYVPTVGDDIEGWLWMTGYISDPWQMIAETARKN